MTAGTLTQGRVKQRGPRLESIYASITCGLILPPSVLQLHDRHRFCCRHISAASLAGAPPLRDPAWHARHPHAPGSRKTTPLTARTCSLISLRLRTFTSSGRRMWQRTQGVLSNLPPPAHFYVFAWPSPPHSATRKAYFGNALFSASVFSHTRGTLTIVSCKTQLSKKRWRTAR